MSTQCSFSIADRADDLCRPWNFWVQPGYHHISEFYRLAEELFTIPVSPLPDPDVSENSDWRSDMAIHMYSYFETWDEFQEVLAEYGTICYSVFESIELVEDEYPAPPREQYGVRIDLKLPDNKGTELYFMVYIYATGRIDTFAMGAARYQKYSQ